MDASHLLVPLTIWPSLVLVPLTIWLSLVAYTASEAGRSGRLTVLGREGPRVMLTVGCLLYLAHVVAAFSSEHAWSHATAYASTARQTEALFGLDWGGGLYVNYAFSALWVSEVVWWWMASASYLHRERWKHITVRAVFLFMIANGAVVFVNGPMRWVGLAIVATLVTTWSTAHPQPGERIHRARG